MHCQLPCRTGVCQRAPSSVVEDLSTRLEIHYLPKRGVDGVLLRSGAQQDPGVFEKLISPCLDLRPVHEINSLGGPSATETMQPQEESWKAQLGP